LLLRRFVVGPSSEVLVCLADLNCDHCQAAARLLVGLPSGGELAFCGHHANEHAAALVGKGVTVIDMAEGFVWEGLVLAC